MPRTIRLSRSLQPGKSKNGGVPRAQFRRLPGDSAQRTMRSPTPKNRHGIEQKTSHHQHTDHSGSNFTNQLVSIHPLPTQECPLSTRGCAERNQQHQTPISVDEEGHWPNRCLLHRRDDQILLQIPEKDFGKRGVTQRGLGPHARMAVCIILNDLRQLNIDLRSCSVQSRVEVGF